LLLTSVRADFSENAYNNQNENPIRISKEQLSTNLTDRADLMVKTFLTSFHNQYKNNPDVKIQKLDEIIQKIEILNTKITSSLTKDLITYVILLLDKAASEINTSAEIEEIFNILE